MTPDPQDVKPLPCPFCGGEAVTPYHLRYQDEAHTRCAVRGCTGDAIGVPVSAWNRRAPSPSTGGASSLRAQIEALPRLSPAADFGDGGACVLGVEHSADGRYLERDAVLALCGDAQKSDREVPRGS